MVNEAKLPISERSFGVVANSCGRYSDVMHHLVIVILLIFNLVTCTLRCSAGELRSAQVVEPVSIGCSCCEHSHETSSSGNSLPENQGCACQDCVCNGAVIVGFAPTQEASRIVSWMQWDVNETASKLQSTKSVDGNAPGPFGYFWSGRNARIVHQSWQI